MLRDDSLEWVQCRFFHGQVRGLAGLAPGLWALAAAYAGTSVMANAIIVEIVIIAARLEWGIFLSMPQSLIRRCLRA
jgi:hypothetical protein